MCPNIAKEFNKFDAEPNKYIKQVNTENSTSMCPSLTLSPVRGCEPHHQEGLQCRRGVRAVPGAGDILPP